MLLLSSPSFMTSKSLTLSPASMKNTAKNTTEIHIYSLNGCTYELIFPALNSAVRKPGRLNMYQRVRHIFVSNW